MATRRTPSATSASACGSIWVIDRQPNLLRQPVAPFALEVEALEQNRRRAAECNDIAADRLQIVGDLLDPIEGVLEGLPVAATKPDEGRHDLDAIGGVIVPEMKALPSVRRLDQPDSRAPSVHGSLPSRRQFMPLCHQAGVMFNRCMTIMHAGL